jgi:rare lipoprotein A
LFLLLCAFSMMAASCAHAPEHKAGRGAYSAVASWYGPGLNGRRTASGETFHQDGLTAAHRTYPFGTLLKVTNPQNGKSCIVVVNDRGPFVAGVDIDISRGASRAIGRLDTGPMLIEEIGRDMGYVKEVHGVVSGKGAFSVQVGSFLDPDNAEHLKQGLEISCKDVRVSQASVDGKTVNRVQVGRFRDKSAAYALARRLADEGYDTKIVSPSGPDDSL